MKRIIGIVCVAVIAAALQGRDACAGTVGAVYNMDAFLNQPHPFANPGAAPVTSSPYPVTPAAAPAHQAISAPAKPAPSRTAGAQGPRVKTKPDAAPARSPSEGWHGLSEIRVGALYNDFGPFSHQKEDGVNANLEFLFVSPDFLDVIWSPRPHIGTSLNTGGDTSVPVYLGLSWEWDFLDDFMWGFSLGGAYHNGFTDQDSAPTDRKELGCSILFRESLKIGYRFNEHHSLMAHFDHISNAKLCDTNEGLESLGVQYGYRF